MSATDDILKVCKWIGIAKGNSNPAGVDTFPDTNMPPVAHVSVKTTVIFTF